MRVRGPDGRLWKVYRRRLAGRPRLPRWVVKYWPEVPFSGEILDLIFGLILALALVVMLPFVLWTWLLWLLCMIVTPAVWALRVLSVRPWPVVARHDDNPWLEWSLAVDGREQADRLVDRVAGEIRDGGMPRSLIAPPGAIDEAVPGTPAVARLTAEAQRLLCRKR